MVTSEVWNKQYRERGYFIKYPDEDLIRFMAKHFYNVPDRKKVKILDIGSGVGRNTIYLAKEGFSAFGVEATDSGIEVSKKRREVEGTNAVFKKGNLTKIPFAEEYFDAVVDIQAIQHNTYEEIKKILQEVKRILKPNGVFFAKMVSTQDYSFKKGRAIEEHTLDNIREGTFVDAGVTHFFDLDELRSLMSIFTEVDIEYTETTFDNMKEKSVYWLITAKRRREYDNTL
jgi:2-polyprenyl-3-methyl-5-hydroxy-6-metoxy-1,4-benzoquinol methylase